MTAVGDVPGTLAYISPERLRGGDATAASDVWAVGVLLWESLAGEHPFWGVPLPQVAAAIEAGAAPIGATRPDLPPALADAVSSALAIEPSKRPSAERLAADLRAALASPRRDRTAAGAAAEGRRAPKPRVDQAVRSSGGSLPRRSPPSRSCSRPRCCRSGRPGSCSSWRSQQVARCFVRPASALRSRCSFRCSRSGTSRRRPPSSTRLSPSRGSRVCWRDARAGLLFVAGPLLASIGALALLPLAVQPARGRVRRALQAFVGVLAAAAVAGLRGQPLPLTGRDRARISASTARPASPTSSRRSSRSSQGNAGLLAVGARAGARGGVPAGRAPARAERDRACSESGQIGLVLFLAPTLPMLSDRARHRRSCAPCSRRSRSRAVATLSREAATPAMSVLRTIESKIEGLFEGVFGRAFRTHVQPVELARKLAKEMDEHRSVSVSRVYVPNEYTIYLSSADRQQFASYEGSLVGELQEYLTEHARREAYALLTPPASGSRPTTTSPSASSGSRRASRSRRTGSRRSRRRSRRRACRASVSIPAPPRRAPAAASAAVPCPRRSLRDDDLPAARAGARRSPRARRRRARARGRDADARRARAPDHVAQRRDRPLSRMRSPDHRRQRLAPPRRDRAGRCDLPRRRPRARPTAPS